MENALTPQFDSAHFKSNETPRLAGLHTGTPDHAASSQPSVPHLSPQQLQFLLQVVPGALESQRVYGIPACVTIAQSILESATSAGWGTSSLFRLANNPFGIKYAHFAPLQEYGHFDSDTWEIVNGQRQDVIAQFQRFPSLTAAFEAHARLLCSNRYESAYAARHDWRQFVERLGPKTSQLDSTHCGYSTNPQYGPALIELVDLYHLDDPRAIEWLTASDSAGQSSSAQNGARPGVSTPIAVGNAASHESSAGAESATTRFQRKLILDNS